VVITEAVHTLVGTISTDKALALDISALPTDQGVTVLAVGTAMVVTSANLFVANFELFAIAGSST
jgi:hypothetical protein